MAAIPTFTLSSGREVPAIAYGSGTLWIKAGSEVDRKVVDGIKTALSVGYRHLDGAQYYNTETELGLGIAESGVPREDIFLTTKALGLSDVEASLKESLSKLKTDYVDLYLIHTPFAATSTSHLQSAWRDMERCLERGLARHIGVSNFAVAHLHSILDVATIRPAVCQVEMHPYLQQPDLLVFLAAERIPAVGFGALTPLTRAAGGPADAVLAELAARHGVSVEAVLLRWVLEVADGVVTTSGRRERMERYLAEVPGFRLGGEDVARINEEARGKRFRAFFAEEFEAFEGGSE